MVVGPGTEVRVVLGCEGDVRERCWRNPRGSDPQRALARRGRGCRNQTGYERVGTVARQGCVPRHRGTRGHNVLQE